MVSVLALCFSHNAKSQQDPMFSQYMFNGLVLNPAYAGSHDFASATLMYRDQWVDFEGAPRTVTAAFDVPLSSLQMGLGFVVANDRLGPTDATDILFNYSYHIKTSENGRLAFGIKGGVANYAINYDKITAWDPDPSFGVGTESDWYPKFGVGIYYYTKRFYVGLSVPTLLAYTGDKFKFDVENSSYLRRHFFLTAGYVFDTGIENLKVKPFSMLKYVENAPLQADFNLSAVYNDRYWLGAGYRTNGAFSVMAEIGLPGNLRLGYAYTFESSKITRHTGATHEVLLGFDFKKKDSRYKSIRYF